MCVTESLCCVTEIKRNIVNQLYFSRIFFLNKEFFLCVEFR